MFRFAALLVVLELVLGAPNPVSNVLKLDLDPNEALQYINNPPFIDPHIVGPHIKQPLVRYDDPQYNAAEAGPTHGHFWKNGQEITDPEKYQEEISIAEQFHGQSGLGDYAYGFKAVESSKVEDRARSGNVKGSYTYKDSNNNLITVRYWADSEGFHQEDNIKPVEESEEIREARLAHERAWQKAAAASLHAPLPEEYHEAVASEVQKNTVPYKSYLGGKDVKTTQVPEPTGPPRGFFYRFTYPVVVISDKPDHYGRHP